MVYLLFICIEYLQEIYTYLGLGSWYLAHSQILLTEVSKVSASNAMFIISVSSYLTYMLQQLLLTSLLVQCVVVMSSVVVVTV